MIVLLAPICKEFDEMFNEYKTVYNRINNVIYEVIMK